MIGRFRRWRHAVRCPECGRRGFLEWHEVGDGFKRGGRFCPPCGYGVHPPSEVKIDVGLGADGPAVARLIDEAIERYKRRNRGHAA